MSADILRPPLVLRASVTAFLAFWLLVAGFPLFWIVAMSFKLPVDAFAPDPLSVVLGPATRAAFGGPGVLDLLAWLAALVGLVRLAVRRAASLAARLSAVLAPRSAAIGWVLACAALAGGAVLALAALAAALGAADRLLLEVPGLAWLAQPVVGFTGQHYRAVWIGHGFTANFANSALVTAGVVTVSLTVGTLAGYALARTRSHLAFWLLTAALVFRALPQSVLVAGYLPVFITSGAWLRPLWDAPLLGGALHLLSQRPPTLYGLPWAVIFVLVSINQPFTIWMLRSFFHSIPVELDEAARVDGCTDLQAFRKVIMPVMWPGVVTAGLFSFLLAYNDYLVCAMLLDAQSQTMVPAITQFFNRETTTTDQVEAVAAAVSITAPLFVLVMAFQRQIVSGLTAGAVKG